MWTNNLLCHTRITLTFLLITLACAACGSGATSSTAPSTPQTQVSLLVNAAPSVQIKRDGWSSYASIGFGALVHPTDVLSGTATLLCADMQTLKQVNGTSGNPCQNFSNATLEYDGMRFASGPRQGNVQTTPAPPIPRILYPRSTSILEKHPLLQWEPTGAQRYAVEIRQGAKVIWTQTAQTNELVYPNDAPELQAGVDYQLVVRDITTGKTSSDESEKGLGFQVISSQERQKIESMKQQISSLNGLDVLGQKLALAVFYLNLKMSGGRGLWGEARILLDEVAQAFPDAPAVQLRRGEALTAQKLWPEAQAAYNTALVEAQKIDDAESQADSLAALWRLTRNSTYVDRAITLYSQLGATDQVTQLQNGLTP